MLPGKSAFGVVLTFSVDSIESARIPQLISRTLACVFFLMCYITVDITQMCDYVTACSHAAVRLSKCVFLYNNIIYV